MPKRHNKNTIKKAEKYIEIHNVTSHVGGGWVSKNAKVSVV